VKAVVVGLGYVGLPLATVLANSGVDVVGVQRRSARSGWKIDAVNKGKSPINGDEPDLGFMVKEAVEKGKLSASESYDQVEKADVVIINVQIPVDDRKKPVLTHLEDACEKIGQRLVKGTLVSLESTVPPGTSEYFVKPILEEESGLKAGHDFNLIYSYERVTSGRLVYNLVNLPRVIGGLTEDCTGKGLDFYSTFCNGGLSRTDLLTAEMSKLVENTYRDVNIALANELSMMCGSLGVDYYEVKGLVNKLPFIEGASNPFRNLHDPGAGVGGHCLPKTLIY
jgi:UDP-N-acetyl-D-mannosaminuronic acid dehydrogenase